MSLKYYITVMTHANKICWHLDFKFSRGCGWWHGLEVKKIVCYKTVKCHFGLSRLDVKSTREAGIWSDVKLC